MKRLSFKERWYLYSDDADLAETLLIRDLNCASSPAERAWLLKHWPSLGGFDCVSEWLAEREPTLLNYVSGRAALLRVFQHRGVANPWLALVQQDLRTNFLRFCQETYQDGGPLQLWLSGGLGDQLECLAQLCDPILRSWWSRLHLFLPVQGQAALEPFLRTHWPVNAPRYSFSPGNPGGNDQQRWLTQMGWSCLLANAGLKPTAQTVHSFTKDSSCVPTLLFCWRSKVDPNDRHWAHLRSLSFVQIARVYAQLVPWATSLGFRLVDITYYRTEEQRNLERHYPTLDLAMSRIASLNDTARIARECVSVVTVDTALVHLARWVGSTTFLLLHRHPDERWREHLRGPSQDHRVHVLRQNSYNQWDDVIINMIRLIKNRDWR